MKKIKSITFDQEAQDNLPQEIKDKMKSNQDKAREERKSKGLNIPSVEPRFALIEEDCENTNIRWLLAHKNHGCECHGNSDMIRFLITKYNDMASFLNEA